MLGVRRVSVRMLCHAEAAMPSSVERHRECKCRATVRFFGAKRRRAVLSRYSLCRCELYPTTLISRAPKQTENVTQCAGCDSLSHTKCVERRAPQHCKPPTGSGGSSKWWLDHQAEGGGNAFLCPKVSALHAYGFVLVPLSSVFFDRTGGRSVCLPDMFDVVWKGQGRWLVEFVIVSDVRKGPTPAVWSDKEPGFSSSARRQTSSRQTRGCVNGWYCAPIDETFVPRLNLIIASLNLYVFERLNIAPQCSMVDNLPRPYALFSLNSTRHPTLPLALCLFPLPLPRQVRGGRSCGGDGRRVSA